MAPWNNDDNHEFFSGNGWPTKGVKVTSTWDDCQRLSLLQISDMPNQYFNLHRNFSSGFFWQSCAVVITSTPQDHDCFQDGMAQKLRLTIQQRDEFSDYKSPIILLVYLVCLEATDEAMMKIFSFEYSLTVT